MADDDREIQRSLDRLVDGESSRAEEAQLLVQLDAVEEGWKRLALGFVEARRWRAKLTEISTDRRADRRMGAPALVRPASGVRSASDPHVAGASAPVAAPSVAWLLAAVTAVSLVIGILGGLAAASWRFDHSSAVTAGGPQARPLAASAPGVTAVTNPDDRNAPDDRAPRADVLTVFVGGGTSDGAQQLNVPLVPVSQIDAGYFDRQPAAVAEQLRQAWEKLGHSVRVNRRYYPVEMNDGRRVVVPIDEVEVGAVDPAGFQ